MPEIYLLIEGKQEGPYSEEQLRQSLADGQIPSDLPAWHIGLADWVPVQVLLKSSAKTQQPPRGSDSSQTKSSVRLNSAPVDDKKKAVYRYFRLGAAIIIGLVIFGFSIGAGVILAGGAFDRLYQPSGKVDVFRVYQPAMLVRSLKRESFQSICWLRSKSLSQLHRS